jgi:phenylpropionate dioxygenase-like ring-hydroxylating dioxygenase large terminal subunit
MTLAPSKLPFDAAFLDSLASSVGPVETARSLPPACYTDESFYTFEKEAIFYREWLCVGRESWLASPGDYFTVTHANEPMILAKGKDGEIRAMSAVCQHRAMLVAEGFGQAKAFVCPYHHWTYGLDGKLVGAPAMERTCDFDRKGLGLPTFKVEIWNGFIFVNMDPEAAPLAPRLTEVTKALANFDLHLAEGPRTDPPTRYPWNWKVMMENNNDGYHATRLHRGPLHDFIPSELATFPDLPADTAGYFRYNGTLHPDVGFNALQKAVLPIFPKLTEAQRNQVLFVNIPPTLSFVFLSDFVLYLTLHAESASSHAMSIGWLVRPGAMEEPLFEARMAMNMSAAMEITAQDLHVDELVQIGLQSKFAPRGRYSWQEQAQRDLNVWLVERYRRAWARQKGETATAPSASPSAPARLTEPERAAPEPAAVS